MYSKSSKLQTESHKIFTKPRIETNDRKKNSSTTLRNLYHFFCHESEILLSILLVLLLNYGGG